MFTLSNSFFLVGQITLGQFIGVCKCKCYFFAGPLYPLLCYVQL